MPRTNSCTQEAVTLQSGTFPAAFHDGFSPVSQKKPLFIHTKCVQKRTPSPFLVDATLCSRTLEVVGCFESTFATVENTWRSYPNVKKAKKRRFCNICTTKERIFLPIVSKFSCGSFKMHFQWSLSSFKSRFVWACFIVACLGLLPRTAATSWVTRVEVRSKIFDYRWWEDFVLAYFVHKYTRHCGCGEACN